MKYKISDNFMLEFTSEVLSHLKKYRQFGKRKEAGGILLGQIFETKVLIDEVTTPSLYDKAGRFFFIRNLKKAQKNVNIAWIGSNGKRIYLGEWHTHPEFKPTPSPDDRNLIFDMLKDSIMEINFLFLVIVGLGENDLYVGLQKDGTLTELEYFR